MDDELMNDYKKMYNKAYEKITPDWLGSQKKVNSYLEQNSRSLVDFFESYSQQFHYPEKDWQDLKVLALGSGLGGMAFHFASKGAQVTGVDVSHLAVSAAREIAVTKGLAVEFIELDVSKGVDAFLGAFDLVFDAHLLHCLVGQSDRKNYFEFVKRHMAQDALFLLETMVFQKQLRTPVGYRMDENYVLWQEVDQEEIPTRKIAPGRDLEQEVKSAGLEINFLYFHAELAFEVFEEYNGYPHQNLPQTARLAAKKA